MERIKEDECLELVVLDKTRMVLVQHSEKRLNYRLRHRQLQLLQHQVQLQRRNVPVSVLIILAEQLPQQKLIVCSFRLLDQLETQSLHHLLYLLLWHHRCSFRLVRPLVGHVLLKWLVVWEVETEIVVEGHELISGETALRDVQQRNELLVQELSSYFARFEQLYFGWVEVLNWIVNTVPIF